ncbi:MAG: hypothetical protein N2712_05700 [Brevinematales bacterium]|nr:hypothetical protein [Brevinematales bacterium]
MRYVIFFILVFIIPLVCYSATDLSVDIFSFLSFGIDNGNLDGGALSSKLKLSSDLGNDTLIYSSLLARYSFIVPNIGSKNLVSIIYPNDFEISLYEVYLKVDEFIFDFVSLSIGRQRLSWGRADRINPTDVLNRFDLMSAIDFSTKYPTWLLNLKIFLPLLDESYIQFVSQPVFESAKFGGSFANMYFDTITKSILDEVRMISSKIYSNPVGELKNVDLNITNVSFGVKVGGRIWGFDGSVSFVSRINDLPYFENLYISNIITIKPISLLPPIVETNTFVYGLNYRLSYHRENIIGFDLSKDFDFVVGWFEMGIFIPQEISRSYNIDNAVIAYSPLPTGTNTNYVSTNYSVNYLKDIYTKYIFGVDRDIEGVFYINFQFAHGLGLERGFYEEKLQDYFIINLERKFFGDVLKIRLYSILNVDDIMSRFSNGFSDVLNNSGVLGGIEVGYYPVIGMKMYINILGIDGNGKSSLARMKDFDSISIGFSMEL